jgi:nucleoid-associated protein EbfC
MSKRGGFPGMGGFGGMNINQLMKEAKKMQADLEKSQTELQAKEFEATAGGGAISVKVSGSKEIKEIKLNKDIVDPDDVEMLQDLIITCVNEALRKVDAAQVADMSKFNMPGMF